MNAGVAGNRARLPRRGWLVLLPLALAFGAEGCGAAERGSAAGGAGGNQAGGSGAWGPDPGAGRGGSLARGGSVATGGTAGRGAGGQELVGGGGAGGDLGIDPACHCVRDTVEGFGADCVLSLQDLFARLRVPTSCETDLNYVIHSSCTDGSTEYSWVEGGENDYRLVFDESGKPVYGSASGYVSALCSHDLPDDGGWTIRAGTAPPFSTCDTCTVCTGFPEGGGAGASTICP